MVNVASLKKSRYLAKEDCEPPLLLTVNVVREENVGMEGQPPDMKYVMHFHEDVKPMILNPTNGEIIARFLGLPDTDDWGGHRIVCYNDPNVSFGGKIVGGIRVRAPRTPPVTNPRPAQPEAPQRPAPTQAYREPPPPRSGPPAQRSAAPREFDDSLDAMYGPESESEPDDDVPY